MSFLEKVRADAKLAVSQVNGILDLADFNRPGCCLWAAIAGVRALRLRGYEGACIQAGSTSYRRLSDEEAARIGQSDCTAFGFEWNPEDSNSVRLMAEGSMPEFHAWVGIPEPGSVNGNVSRKGVIVDFSSHYFPEMFEHNEKNWKWGGPRPENPTVFSDEIAAQADHDSFYYEANAEATLYAAVMGQSMLVKSALSGRYELAALLWPVFDQKNTHAMLSPSTVERAMNMTPERALRSVRRVMGEMFSGLDDRELRGRRLISNSTIITNKGV